MMSKCEVCGSKHPHMVYSKRCCDALKGRIAELEAELDDSQKMANSIIGDYGKRIVALEGEYDELHNRLDKLGDTLGAQADLEAKLADLSDDFTSVSRERDIRTKGKKKETRRFVNHVDENWEVKIVDETLYEIVKAIHRVADVLDLPAKHDRIAQLEAELATTNAMVDEVAELADETRNSIDETDVEWIFLGDILAKRKGSK